MSFFRLDRLLTLYFFYPLIRLRRSSREPRIPILMYHSIESEVRRSKEKIEHEIGESIKSFSYPYAFPETDNAFTKYLRSIIEAGGYENGVTTSIGTATKEDDIFFLKRIPLNSFDDLPFFTAKLEGGYDWLCKLQYLVKLAKRSRKLFYFLTRNQNKFITKARKYEDTKA